MIEQCVSMGITLSNLPDDAAQRPVRMTHEAMACTWGIDILGEEPRYAEQAARAAFAEVDRLERELSLFLPTSDVSRLNAARPGQAVRIGVDAYECLELALEMCRRTGGAFDVTVGSWKEREQGAGQRERGTGIREQGGGEQREQGTGNREHGGGLVLERASRSAVRQADGLVDLGGIGKGFALDRAAALLREWGVHAALLHSGQSTVLALGSPPGAEGWRVSLRDPGDHARTIGTVLLRDRALAGSGIALHGQHIIDPRTGLPATHRPAAWAHAPSAAVADALSTALMVMSDAEAEAAFAAVSEEGGMVLRGREPEGRQTEAGQTRDELRVFGVATGVTLAGLGEA